MQLDSHRVPPVGVVTMLFTDIEGSTRLAQELGDAWVGVLTEHRRIVREAIFEAGGYIGGTEGDSFFATFAHATAAVSAAMSSQRALREYAWPGALGELRVRMGLHSGPVEFTDGHYVGIEVHRAARVGAAACGAQVILTEPVRAQLRVSPEIEDLGWHRLKDFPDAIRLFHLVVDEDRRAAAFPPPRTLDARPTNLPPEDRPLVGRGAELQEIVRAFLNDDARLVTVTGLGGVGKTTMALAAARTLLDAYPRGVWLVRAEALTSGRELLEAIAATLHVRDVPGVDLLVTLGERLETGRCMLVLDNLEHLTDAAVRVAELLRCGTGVAIMATSRAPLRLESERAIALGSMAPSEAVDMFMARATAVDPELSLEDAETREAVERLCERLGCLPLALELAAARLRLMTPRQLLDRLGSALDIRASERDRPERHRSVRATIEWTLGLLPEDAATLFTRLGIFSGTPSLDVIEMVCGNGIDVLEAAAVLVDYSLLRKSGPGLGLVEALREVASERLASSPELEDLRYAHAAAMIVLGRSVRSPSTAGAAAMASVERLLPDTWAAARWTREHDAAMHRALVSNLSGLWAMKGGLRVTMAELDAALERDGVPPVERADLLLSKSYILLLSGRPDEGLAAVEESLALMPPRSDLDRGGDLHLLSQAQLHAGLVDEAIATGRSALEHHRRAGSTERTVLSLITLAQTMMRTDDIAEAGRLLDEAEILGEGLGTLSAMGVANIRADWMLQNGDPARALAGYVDSLTATMASFGEWVLYDIAGIAVALEQLGAAEAALEVASIADAGAVQWGTTVDTFNRFNGGVPEARERARRAVAPDAALAAEVRGRNVAPGARVQRALALARSVLAKEEVP